MNKRIKATWLLILTLGAGLALAGSAQQEEDPGVLLRAAIEKEEVEGDLQGAIALYQKIIADYRDDRSTAAKAQLRIGLCYEKLGFEEAPKAFQKVIDNYPDQTEAVTRARIKLAALTKVKAVVQKVDQDLSIQRVWSDRGTSILGDISRDGKYLSFTNWDTGDLAIRDLTTGKNRRLTDKGSWIKSQEFALFSRWSRDGNQVAYTWYIPDGSLFELHVVGLEDPKPRILFDNKEYEWVQPFDWHPNGEQILTGFFKGGDTIELGFVSVEDKKVKVLKTIKQKYATNPPWGFSISPDGRFIAYDDEWEQDMNNRDIFLISVDRAHEIRLIDHPSLDYVFGWTADGTHLLFGSERTGDRGVWIIRVEDGEAIGPPRLVKSGIGPAYPIGITRNNQFYYGFNLLTNDVYVAGIEPTSGRILAAPRIEVRHYEGHNAFPDYSPDGKYLAYTSLRNSLPMGSNAICIYSLENGEIHELDPGLGRFDYPQWRPDGKAVSLEGTDKDGRKGIYLIEIESDRVSPIVQIADDERIFAHRWSVDGRTLFYTKGKERGENAGIYRHDLRTDVSEVLPGSPDDAKDIDVSHDGETLVLLNRSRKERRSLRIMPSGGGEPEELYSFETEGEFVITPAWSPDGQSIFFPAPLLTTDGEELIGGAPADRLWRFSIKDRKAQMLDIKMSRIRHLSVHPDGRHITFSSFGRELQHNEIWVMENFLLKANAEK